MSENTPTNNVRSTGVKITLNAKSLGLDAFVTFEEQVEFTELTDNVSALLKREEMTALITDQLLAVIKDTAATVKAAVVTALPAAVVPQPAGIYQGQAAPAGTGAAAVHAVANGASSGMQWLSAPDRFDAAKQVRFLSQAAFSQDQMKQAAAEWLASQGFNAAMFDCWDERNATGAPISSVCNIKVKKDYTALVPSDVVATNTGGAKAVARAKFNNDGSLYFYWSKDAEAAAKYGALAPLKLGAAAPMQEEEAF